MASDTLFEFDKPLPVPKKGGRPKGSKNKPRVASSDYRVTQAPGQAPGQAPNVIKVISDPKPLDILCERGGKSNFHPGNNMYRSLGRALVPLVKESNSLDSRSRC
ncbi:hypothetical protein TrCOL_g10759, partial [Triparma columacea]